MSAPGRNGCFPPAFWTGSCAGRRRSGLVRLLWSIRGAMADIVSRFAPLAVAAVAVILFLGLLNMMRGGSGNRSQQLMRLRVIFQLIAIIVVMAALYFATLARGG